MDNATPTGSGLAKRDTSPVGKFTRELEERAVDIQMALPQGISAAKFQRAILTAVAANQDLLRADRGSLVLSCYKAAQDGLVPDGREAAFVTFKKNFKDGGGAWMSLQLVQYMPMVYGLRKKILQAKDANGQPIVSALQVGVVYKAEAAKGFFLWQRGSDPEVQHRPMLDITAEEARDENIVAAYSIAIMADGTRSCEVMRRFEIDEVRECSQTGALFDKKGKPRDPSGPWVDWFAEMAKKTVMRRHAKTLPMSSDVIAELGGEDDEILAARSAALALGGTAPEDPALITDESGGTIDGSTGEIIDEGGGNSGQAEAEPEKKKRSKAKEAQPEKAEADEAGADQGGESEDRDEQIGITKDPGEPVAERLLGEFASAKDEDALDALWNGSELERASLSEDLHVALTNGFNRALKRIREAQPAGAK